MNKIHSFHQLLQFITKLSNIEPNLIKIIQGFVFIPTRLTNLNDQRYIELIPTYKDDVYIQKIWQPNHYLKGVIVNNKVKTINFYAFYNCRMLSYVVLPKSLKQIKDSCFSACMSLKYMYIPDSVTNIDEASFQFCSDLQHVRLPKNIEVIASYTFYGCFKLKSIYLPKSIKSIGYYAFSACKMLKTIKLPLSLTKICDGAFDCCYALEIIHIYSSFFYKNINKIGRNIFKNCNNISTIYIHKNIDSFNIKKSRVLKIFNLHNNIEIKYI